MSFTGFVIFIVFVAALAGGFWLYRKRSSRPNDASRTQTGSPSIDRTQDGPTWHPVDENKPDIVERPEIVVPVVEPIAPVKEQAPLAPPVQVEKPKVIDKPIEPPFAPPVKTTQATPLAPMIYIIDDSVVIRTKLKKLIAGAGYRIETGGDGFEGVELFKVAQPALLITDIEMPNMDGYEFIAALDGHPDHRSIPVIAISGHDGIRENLAHYPNVVDTFKKPWDELALIARLEVLVGPGIISPNP